MHTKQGQIKNKVYNCFFDNLIKETKKSFNPKKKKKKEIKNILIDEKSYKDLF